MLKNEVASDVAAPAMEKTNRNEGLISEFNNALSDSTALKVVAGTAVIAAGTIATVAAIKYAKPALEAGKAVGAVTDEGVLAAPAFDALLKESGTLETAVAKMFGRKVPMTERLGFKEVDPKIPMFLKTGDIAAMMPETGPNAHRVVMKLDGIPRALNLTDATAVLAERSMTFIARNPNAAKALAAQMPKPAMESDIAATAARIAQRSA